MKTKVFEINNILFHIFLESTEKQARRKTLLSLKGQNDETKTYGI
jgi:hypothetical protein